MIKAIIFDMNGVIVDDEPVHERAFREVLKNYGVNLSPENYRELCFGKTDRDGFISVVENFSLGRSLLNELAEAKAKKYQELIAGDLQPVPGVVDLIANLSKKYKLALASGAIRPEIEMTLGLFGLEKYFSVVVSGEEVEVGKPNPEQYLLTARKLGEGPNSCLVVEDSQSGVQAAKAAGMACLAITTSFSQSELMLADKVIDDFSEVDEKIIESLG